MIWNDTSWDRAPASIDWSVIHGVTVNGNPTANGQDLLPTTGGTMSGDLTIGDGTNANRIKVLSSGVGSDSYIEVADETGIARG